MTTKHQPTANKAHKQKPRPAEPTKGKENDLQTANPQHILQRAKADPRALSPRDVLQLQRASGNGATRQLLGRPALPGPAVPARAESSAGAVSVVQRKLISQGNDRFYGDRTDAYYKFEIEPETEEEYEGPEEGETVTAKFNERPVFIEESTDEHLAVVTVAIREKEKIKELFARLGVSHAPPSEADTISGPGKVDDTNRARKGLILKSYIDVINDKKTKYQKAGKWADSLESQFGQLKDHIAGGDILAGWQVLKTLIQNINRVKGVEGASPVKMTEEEKLAIRKALPLAKSRAFNLLLNLHGDTTMIKAQFRVTETEDVDNIKGNLRKIAQHILRLKDEQILLDEDGTVAFNRGGAVNSGVGSKSTITFSRNWLSHSDDRKAAELIHEASHGTEGVATKDLAYLGYWADAVIKGKSAIVNAPTYERAALAKGAETSGEEAPKGKTLTLNQGYEQHNDRFVKILGKIDFHTTQAWWFVNNISKFAKQIPSDADLKGDKNEKGYRWSLLKSNHPYVANVCAQIGAPVAKTQPPDGRTVFTPVDQELINLYVRCLAGIKDAVHLISQVNVVTEPPAKFIDDNVVNLPAGALAQSDEAIEAWIVQQVVGLNKIPESIAGSGKFYDRIVQASKWKDGVEPDIDKSGVT